MISSSLDSLSSLQVFECTSWSIMYSNVQLHLVQISRSLIILLYNPGDISRSSCRSISFSSFSCRGSLSWSPASLESDPTLHILPVVLPIDILPLLLLYAYRHGEYKVANNGSHHQHDYGPFQNFDFYQIGRGRQD